MTYSLIDIEGALCYLILEKCRPLFCVLISV
jgi:hypothetical protein